MPVNASVNTLAYALSKSEQEYTRLSSMAGLCICGESGPKPVIAAGEARFGKQGLVRCAVKVVCSSLNSTGTQGGQI